MFLIDADFRVRIEKISEIILLFSNIIVFLQQISAHIGDDAHCDVRSFLSSMLHKKKASHDALSIG